MQMQCVRTSVKACRYWVTFAQESLEDVGAELQQMSGELHKLMREIENKEQTIESLEKELRTARDTADAKLVPVSSLSCYLCAYSLCIFLSL